MQKFWRINNTVLDLFLQYLDESIARRLRGGGDASRDPDRSHAGTAASTAAASREGSSAPSGLLVQQVESLGQPPPETSSFEDQYFNFLSNNWEGENAVGDLGFILDPQFSIETPAGGPAQLDGLNFLERRL